jgi:hypothetical protein
MKKILSSTIAFILAAIFILYIYGFFGIFRKTRWKKEPIILIFMAGVNIFFWIVTIKYLFL